ncbi:MAG: hypothetical protein CALGDGBN_01546 [Pseudomonadales bacterium]|nr:hypothetical protein [Pseudomonadales bacterium]
MKQLLAATGYVLIALYSLAGLPLGAGTVMSAWASPDTEEQVESEVEDEVEDQVEDEVEDQVEDEVEDQVEDQVEDEVEDEVESDVEDEVEDEVESEVEDEVEDEVDSALEDEVEDEVESDAEEDLEHKIEAGIESGIQQRLDDDVAEEADANPRADGRRAGMDSGRSIAAEAAVERLTGLDADEEGNEIAMGEWLVIASREDIEALESLGYLTRSVESLAGLDRVLARLEAPQSFDIDDARAAIRRAAPDAGVDYNHVYRPEAKAPLHAVSANAPGELMPSLTSGDNASITIGLIDTGVVPDHPALRGARMQHAEFVPPESRQTSRHGTSVLSILVGQTSDYRGLLPGAQVYVGAVFFIGPDGREIATTTGLVRALDWMTQHHVPVVNMSLAGPRNGILEAAIDRSFDVGTVVVAAVGNRGPTAPPLYPAACENVVAVTAVSRSNRIYRLANRGAQVDFAAPGVDVRHADGASGYRTSSGTSLAAPFVTAVIATSCTRVRPYAACLAALQRNAEDAGATGFDPVFGYGVIRPLSISAPP